MQLKKKESENQSKPPSPPSQRGSETNHTFLGAIETKVSGNITDIETIIDIFGIYFPNGGKSEQAWQDKLVFYREFASYMDELRNQGHSVIW